MATEKQQFHYDALFYNQLQNILDFCQKNSEIWWVTIRFFCNNSYKMLCTLKPST